MAGMDQDIKDWQSDAMELLVGTASSFGVEAHVQVPVRELFVPAPF